MIDNKIIKELEQTATVQLCSESGEVVYVPFIITKNCDNELIIEVEELRDFSLSEKHYENV